jgi:hypothetical protein
MANNVNTLTLENDFGFTDELYEAYLKRTNRIIADGPLRDEGQSLWDALLSDDADYTKTPEGKAAYEFFRTQ